jgi:hypothetical protein
MNKLFQIKYERRSGEWVTGGYVTPSEMIVAESKEKAIEICKEMHPDCDWYGGSEVGVEGYNIIALADDDDIAPVVFDFNGIRDRLILKTYMGVTTGTPMGRDDGYPEKKTVLYGDFDSVSSGYGTKKQEEYFLLIPIETERIEFEVHEYKAEQKELAKEKKRRALQVQIDKLQEELDNLE